MTQFKNIPIGIMLAMAILLSVCHVHAQDKSTLSFKESVWDFGDIEEVKGEVSHIFTFTNTGTNVIAIENVSVSCGCTSPEYSKQPIKPGAKGEIKITYDPENRPGNFSKDIYVISNGGKNRNTLTVRGVVVPRPRSVEEDHPYAMAHGLRFDNLSVNFRYIEQANPVSQVIKYANTSGKEVKLGFRIDSDNKVVKASAPETICAGCQGDITISADIPKGDTYGKFIYKVYPVINGEMQKQSFSVSGIAVDDFSAVDKTKAPESKLSAYFHNFGKVKGGRKLEKEFTLQNTGASPLIIRHVEGRLGMTTDLKIGTVVGAGKSIVLKCTLDTSKTNKGTITQVLTIITNDPVRPMREIRLAANVE